MEIQICYMNKYALWTGEKYFMIDFSNGTVLLRKQKKKIASKLPKTKGEK